MEYRMRIGETWEAVKLGFLVLFVALAMLSG